MATELASPDHPVTSIVYCGTPEVAVPPLQALHAAGFDIRLVLTGEDKRRGRGSKSSPSPVKRAAVELGLTVSHDPSDLATVDVDLGVVVAYGRIIKTSVLKRTPMVNLHFSLLPRWRGAAPVERAILAGDAETGVCVMAVAPKLDSGGIYRQQIVPIDSSVTLDELRAGLVETGSALLVNALQTGLGDPVAQEGEITYAEKMDPAEYELDFGRSAIEAHRMVRLGSAWTTFRGKRLKVLATDVMDSSVEDGSEPGAFDGEAIVTPTGRLQLLTVQPAGKKVMEAKAWFNGVQPKVGERFG